MAAEAEAAVGRAYEGEGEAAAVKDERAINRCLRGDGDARG